MTSATGRLRDEGSSATDEGVVTSGGDDDEGLTTLDSRGSIAVVALVLVDSEGLASDGGLINLEESIFGNNATVGGDNSTLLRRSVNGQGASIGKTHLLNLEDITGNDLGSLNLLEGTVTEDNSLESKSLLEFVDNGTSLVFLDETDTGVEHQKTANDTEIDPILKTGSENSGTL